MEIQLQLILTAYLAVNSGWTLVQSRNPIADQVVTSNPDDSSTIQRNIQNLFNFAAKDNVRKREAYQEIVKQETAKGQHNFNKMKEELKSAQYRNTIKKINLYKRSNTGKDTEIKREISEQVLQENSRQQTKKLPIGITNIREILEGGYIYVDKTSLILNLILEHTYDCFMVRPKGFGKTLLLSTLEEIFKGNKELFKGTAIYQSDYNWLNYAVLRFDFSRMSCREPSEFENALKEEMKRMSIENGISPIEGADLKMRLRRMVEQLSKKTGARVVILVDEYDAPVTNSMADLEIAEKCRNVLSDFIAAIIAVSGSCLQFTFVTGVHEYSTCGSQGCGKDQLVDITLGSKYATMMGFTKDELEKNFADYEVPESAGSKTPIGNILGETEERYHGYRFSDKEVFVYNPSSILTYLQGQSVAEYHSLHEKIPDFLVDNLRKDPRILFTLQNSATEGFFLQQRNQISHGFSLEHFLFHLGYLTIRGFHMRNNWGTYELDFRNEDVKKTFFRVALEGLTQLDAAEITRDGDKMKQDLATLDVNSFMASLSVHISKIPVEMRRDATLEYYRATFYLLMKIYGCETEIALRYSRAKISNVDIFFKFTLEQSAESALEQVMETPKNGSQEILCVGINFSEEASNIKDWKATLVHDGKVVREFP